MVKKYIFILGTLDKGGTEIQSCKLAISLKKKYQSNILFLIFRNRGKLRYILKKHDISYKAALGAKEKINAFIFFKIIKFYLVNIYLFKPNMIQGFLPYGNLIASFFGLILNIKSCIFIRGSLNHQKKNKIWYLLDFFSLYFAKKVFSNSYCCIKQNIRKYKFKKKIIYIPNYINDLNKISFKQKKKIIDHYKLSGYYIIGCVANFLPYKGHLYLINFLKLIQNRYKKKIKLLLIGQDYTNYKKKIVKNINRLKLNNDVIFIDQKYFNVNKLFQIFNLKILPSEEESSPNAVLEAMSLKVPVIASNVGDLKKILGNNRGFVIKSKNVEDMHKKFITYMNLSNKNKKIMLNNAKNYIEDNFNFNKSINKYYKEINL